MRRLPLLMLCAAAIACQYQPPSPATAGDLVAMKHMLDNGFNPNSHDASGYTPLINAARAGDVPVIRLLTSHGADPNLPDAAVNAWPPLLHAVHKAQPASTTALLDAGANPNRADPTGTTPLMMAAGYGYTDIVKILLARGANPRMANNDGVTAIDLARAGVADIDRFTVFQCQDETVRTLLAADPKLPDHSDNLQAPARLLFHMKRCGA